MEILNEEQITSLVILKNDLNRHHKFWGVSDLQMERLGIQLKEISKTRGNPQFPWGIGWRPNWAVRKQGTLHLKMHLLSWKNLWESAVPAAQGKLATFNRKAKRAEFLSEQESLWSGFTLLWYGRAFPDGQDGSTGRLSDAEWRVSLTMIWVQKFPWHKVPLVQDLFWWTSVSLN